MKPEPSKDFQRAVKELQGFIQNIDVTKTRGFVLIWKQQGNGIAEKALMKFGGLTDDQLSYLLWNEALETREESHKNNPILMR